MWRCWNPGEIRCTPPVRAAPSALRGRLIAGGASSSAAPEIRAQLQRELDDAFMAGTEREAIQNVETVRALEAIDECDDARIASFDTFSDIQFHDSVLVGFVLLERGGVGLEAGARGDFAEIGDQRGVAGSDGTELIVEEMLALLLDGGQVSADIVAAGDI